MNPFFEPYNTPHDTVPFDRITADDFEEAFKEGIRRSEEQIEKTVKSTARPTFDNMFVDKDPDHEDGYYDLLDRVSNVFFNLLSAETDDRLEAIATKIQPLLTAHSNFVRLNRPLFERTRAVHRHHRRLTPEEKRLLDDCYTGFTRSGALLDDSGKQQLRQLTEELSRLTLQFSQNLLKETKAFTLHITDPAELEGLPETAREAAAAAAREKGEDGWIFTLDAPSYSPFMTYSAVRDLRRQMYMAKNTICTHDNAENNIDICRRIINLRREISVLLGAPTFADHVLRQRMAGTPQAVYKMLDELIDAYKPAAEREVKAITALARRTEGRQYKLLPWDFSYYSHKLQLLRYDLDAEMLRPYFELSRVIDGVFGLATRLYGITFKANDEIQVYHPDVRAYEVFDADGSYLAVFYADFHPRKGKQSGAWMTEYKGQWIERDGTNSRPHVSLVMNLTKPTPDKPALLTLGEVETFLHEFGHALHGMFANTRFAALSGTNVWWDFVELPSQFMENYSVEKDFLRTFAFHYQTGEPLPDELIDRIVKSRNFLAAYSCMRQVSFGLLDMAYYTLRSPLSSDLIKFEKKAWERAMVMPQRDDTCMTVQFSHIMSGGYAAGYYSYKWAEVLDADAFSVFKRGGIFNRNTAARFRRCILSRGGTDHPMTLYKNFRGAEPSIKALLRRDGIKTRQRTADKQ